MNNDALLAYSELRQLLREDPSVSDAEAAHLAGLDLSDPEHQAFLASVREDAAREREREEGTTE